MIVTLTAEQEKFIAERINKGEYSSLEKVIEEALRLMQLKVEYEHRLTELRQEIQSGSDQISRGETVDGPTAIRNIREKLRDREAGR